MPKSSPLRRATRASACGRRSCPSRSYPPGAFLAENLHLAGRDGGWLEAELKRRSLTAEQVLLLTVDAAGTVYLVRKEDLA